MKVGQWVLQVHLLHHKLTLLNAYVFIHIGMIISYNNIIHIHTHAHTHIHTHTHTHTRTHIHISTYVRLHNLYNITQMKKFVKMH